MRRPTPDRRTVLQTLGIATGAAALGSTLPGVSADDYDEANATQMSYDLPDLPYEYDALEPHIDERIMELHHGAHHQAYVDGANEALETVDEMRAESDFEGVRAAKRDFSFNLSGHVNHVVFWDGMSPDGGGDPDGELLEAIEADFGSVEAFRAEFTAAAENVEGDGWAMLFYEPLADGLVIGQLEGQNDLAHQGSVPLLALDVWEHAYYLQYENDRAAYVEAWWSVVDWDEVACRYEAITSERAHAAIET
ncbi:superoxide dismutase [Natrononativus amylolyticus]|uniref:superoxide dismutase n=1 Tax=Natrononativus amylolyticus TaxID=2963434 RepID=UPI0020CDB781|nr:superoxide dismutase [Natrononativus amylolyticus]